MEKSIHEKIRGYNAVWVKRCYKEGIPDTVPFEVYDKAPSWQKIAMCVLKNDLYLTGLGFKGFESVYYGELKRIELKARTNQTTLF